MNENHQKIARILRTSPEVIFDLDQKMSAISGTSGTLDGLIQQNDETVDQMLAELKLTRSSTAEEVYNGLISNLIQIDEQLSSFLGQPDPARPETLTKLVETVKQIYMPEKGFFIKKEKVAELLAKFPPQNMIDHFGYKDVAELLAKEDMTSVLSALRFTQDQDWMHKFFEISYQNLSAGDFEERDVEIKVLDPKWGELASKFLKKKFHNISHLKEYGIIFIIPKEAEGEGETTRTLTLLLHYLHEVPFYSLMFKKPAQEPNFVANLDALLRGDVFEGQFPNPDKMNWRIIQQYLAKDDEDDPKLFEPHINPEAEHWFGAMQSLDKLSRISGQSGLEKWKNLGCVGGFFPTGDGTDKFVSFELIDLIMSLVKKGEVKYIYHHQEALWNEIFVRYLGRDRMNQVFENDILKGYIEL